LMIGSKMPPVRWRAAEVEPVFDVE